jgi:hypothetical protein
MVRFSSAGLRIGMTLLMSVEFSFAVFEKDLSNVADLMRWIS